MFIKPCMVLFFTGFSHEIPSCTLYSSSQSFFDFWNIPSTTLSPPTPFMRAAVSPGPGLKVTVTQLCLTVCYPMDCTVHWIVQARILEWVAVLFSRGVFPTQSAGSQREESRPWQRSWGKKPDKTQRCDLASGVPPGFSWTSTPNNQSLPALLCCAFHSSDILWKKLTQGFS